MIDLEIQDEIKNKTAKDDFFAKALQAVKENGPLPIRFSLEEWKIEKGMLFFKDRCYIPHHEELRREVVNRYHDTLTGGHPGIDMTLLLVARNDSFCQELCRRMRNLSTNEGQHTPDFIRFNTDQRTKRCEALLTSHL